MNGQEYGALPIQMLQELVESGAILHTDGSALQPSSFDLSISDKIYRLPGSFMPREGERILDIVKVNAIDTLKANDVLRCNDVYISQLRNKLKLPPGIHGRTSSKSSTGRINLRCKMLADGFARFDEIPSGYHGSLWVEIVPKSFDCRLMPNMQLNQLRLFHGASRLSSIEHELSFERHGFLRDHKGKPLKSAGRITPNGVLMTVDLSTNDIVAYRARKPPEILNLNHVGGARNDPSIFFEPIHRPKNGKLILQPGEFYLLVTKERIVIPPEFAAEMVQYDPSIGNLFTHFAGFFDPGFGWRDQQPKTIMGNVAVMEVVVNDFPVVLYDGQPICTMAFERMLRIPKRIYGAGIKSNYGVQDDVKLAKFFDAG